MKKLYPMIAAVALLAACSSETPTQNVQAGANETAPVAAVPPPGAPLTVAAGQGEPLGVVTEVATSGLKGELRCGFTDSEGALRFAGAGDVDKSSKATGVVMRGGAAVPLEAAVAGGLDAMLKGGRFVGEGMVVTLTRGAKQETGHEGSRNAATLKIEPANAEASSIEGLWECGP